MRRLREGLRRLLLLAAVILLAAGAAAPATAQALPGALTEAAPPPSKAELDALLKLLDDPAARAQLVARLRALRAGLDEPPVETVETGVFDWLSQAIAARVDGLVRVLARTATIGSDLPMLREWLVYQVENDFRRAIWGNVALGLAQALGLGALAWLLVHRLVRQRREELPLGIRAHIVMAARDLAPLTAFALVTGLVLDLGAFLPATARVGWIALTAILLDRVLTVLLRRGLQALGGAVGVGGHPEERAPSDGSHLLRVLRILVYGGMLLLAAGRLGLPPDLYDLAGHLLSLVVGVATTVLILAHRQLLERLLVGFASWIEGDYLRRLLPLGALAGQIHRWVVAVVWANVALVILGVGLKPVRATLGTLGILLLAHLLLTWLDRPRSPKPAPEEAEEGGEPSVGRAVPPLALRLLKTALKLVVVVAIAEVWGAGLLPWLGSPHGHATLLRLLRILAVLAACTLGWRLSSWWIGRYITARDAQGNVLYSNRSRTAAAIAKSLILVFLGVLATTNVLTELGIQTAPLLAGAGVIGLAVGFGSQKLVQDIINGLFILLGDTIRVGDVVDLGGRSGVVEAMSMRTVTLRSYNGDVHTIPFGTIDQVTNMTRDFSYWVLDVSIAYRENVDRVVEVLQQLEQQMRREWPWRRLVLEPMEMAGLDRLGDSAVVIRARIKTRPGEQWRVGREFNRRMKRRFDELGIEIPFPQLTIHAAAEDLLAAAAVVRPPPAPKAAGGHATGA